MKVKEFKALSKAQQIEFVQEKGKFIATRTYLNFKIDLYAVPEIFVEFWYHHTQSAVYYVEIQNNKEILLEYVDEEMFKKWIDS